jgi:hypothetical protein
MVIHNMVTDKEKGRAKALPYRKYG